jgi:hypothetical protein
LPEKSYTDPGVVVGQVNLSCQSQRKKLYPEDGR